MALVKRAAVVSNEILNCHLIAGQADPRMQAGWPSQVYFMMLWYLLLMISLYNWCDFLSKLVHSFFPLVKVIVAVINALYSSDFMI